MPSVFDPIEFFALGQRLVRASSDESNQRTAIGRAYYTCHLVARDQLYGVDGVRLTPAIRKKLTGKKHAGSHEAIIEAIRQNPRLRPVQQKRLSDQLAELKDLRICADYLRDSQNNKTVRVFKRYDADSWQELASFALTLASSLLPDLQRLRP